MTVERDKTKSLQIFSFCNIIFKNKKYNKRLISSIKLNIKRNHGVGIQKS